MITESGALSGQNFLDFDRRFESYERDNKGIWVELIFIIYSYLDRISYIDLYIRKDGRPVHALF